ncbi:MAG: ABC transporter permease [Phycisphaerae bacterium]
MFHLRLLLTALRGLRQNLLRSMLATLGVIIGVGAVVAAVSILEGAQRDILDRFESLGADQVIVFNGSERRRHRVTQVQSLLPEDAQLIKRENEDVVRATAPQFQGGGQIKYRERNTVASVLGTTESYALINNYNVLQGRFITRPDVHGSGMVCILGYQIAQDLFGARPAVGKSVKINGKSLIVVGVMEERGTLGFMEVDNQVIIPLTTAMGRMFGRRNLTMLVVQCIDAKHLPVCIERVKKTLRVSHRIRAGADDDFTVFTQEQFKQQFAQIAVIFAVVLYSIAGISIVVGAIGIMNIMLVSVTERTREIGVRIACGARRFDILRQFLTEASIISLIGGGLGVACGWAIANFLGEFTQVLKIYTPPIIIVLALLMATLVGIVSGIYPAVRAARLDPVQALRFE